MRLDRNSAAYGSIHPLLDRPSDVIWLKVEDFFAVVKAARPPAGWLDKVFPVWPDVVRIGHKQVRIASLP